MSLAGRLHTFFFRLIDLHLFDLLGVRIQLLVGFLLSELTDSHIRLSFLSLSELNWIEIVWDILGIVFMLVVNLDVHGVLDKVVLGKEVEFILIGQLA